VLATASAIAAALLIVQLLLPPGPAGPRLSAAAEIKNLGEIAARRSTVSAAPNEFVYQRYEESRPQSGTPISGSVFYYNVQVLVETWSAADGSGYRETTYKQVVFASPLDRENWENAGSPSLVPTEPIDRESEGPGSLAVYGVESLPTDPDALRSAILDGTVIVPGSGSRDLLATIGTLLAQEDLPSELRQALFEVASSISGVTVEHDVLDPRGRPAVVVSAADGPTATRLFFDPADATLLGREITHAADGVHPGSIEARAYLESGLVSKVGERPSP
jgi:hypothetical protein